MNTTEALLLAALAATAERKKNALRVLCGEAIAKDPVTTNTASEPYLTVRELCGRLNVSRTSLWRWGVPGHQWRDSRRYRLSEVIEYLESAEFKRKAADLRAERRGTVSGSK